MATQQKCPNCDKMTPHQKKGTSSTGAQRWRCNECKKQWTEGAASAKPKAKAKKAAPKKAAAKGIETKKTTVIKVNGNEIKKVKGELSNDEGFDLVSDYFREVTKTNVKRTEAGDTITIAFQVQTGRKG